MLYKWLTVKRCEKLNLGSPDMWNMYWNDLRTKPKSFFQRAASRQSCNDLEGEGGVFGFNSLDSLDFLLNAQKYQERLNYHFLLSVDILEGPKWILKQSTVSIYVPYTI